MAWSSANDWNNIQKGLCSVVETVAGLVKNFALACQTSCIAGDGSDDMLSLHCEEIAGFFSSYWSCNVRINKRWYSLVGFAMLAYLGVCASASSGACYSSSKLGQPLTGRCGLDNRTAKVCDLVMRTQTLFNIFSFKGLSAWESCCTSDTQKQTGTGACHPAEL